MQLYSSIPVIVAMYTCMTSLNCLLFCLKLEISPIIYNTGQRGARGRLVFSFCSVACLLCSLSPGAPRGVPGEGLSLCSLSPGAPRGVPGEGLSVFV